MGRPLLIGLKIVIILCITLTEESVGRTHDRLVVSKENETIRIRRAIKNPFKVDPESLMSTVSASSIIIASKYRK